MNNQKKIKILHVADTHIGYTTHGKTNSKSGVNSRIEDFARCLRVATDAAVTEEVDIALICGDLYKNPHPSQSEQRIFAQCIKPLLDARIPVVIVTGNHDNPVAFGKAASTEIFGDLLTGQVTVISSPKAVVIETKRGPIDVIGMPWPVSGMLRADPRFKDASRDDLNAVVIDQYGRWLDDALRLRHPDRPRVIAGHIEVRGAKLTEGSERSALMTKDPVFPVSMLARHEVDYVALGHIHMHQDLNAGSKPPVIYSGSVERISFNEEGQPKGFVIADVWRGGCEWQHIETPAREMVTIDVAIPEDELFVGHVVETAISQRPQWRLNDAIVRVRVTCTTAQRQEIKVADIRKLLNDAKVSAIAGIDIEVTDKPVRARAPEISADGGKFEIFSAYLSSVNTAQSEQDVLMAMAAELDGGRGE